MAKRWTNEDGSLNTALLDELEDAVRAVTDKTGGIMDRVEGKGMLPAFRCGHSGLLLPPDYVKEWGSLYGIGLGPDPVSEVLDSEYGVAPPAITPEIRRMEQIMFPVRVSRAQVDWDLVTPEEFKAGAAILAIDDEDMEERADIIRSRQLRNPAGSPLVALYTEWTRQKGRYA